MHTQTPVSPVHQKPNQLWSISTAEEYMTAKIETETKHDNYLDKEKASRLSAIQEFPPELLTQIFQHYLADKLSRIEHLLFVCKSWNHLVTHTFLLWTRVRLSVVRVVDSKLPRGRMVEFPSRHIEYHLKKTGDMLLDIELDYVHVSPDDPYNYIALNKMIAILQSAQPRWRSVQIILPLHNEVSEVICSMLSGSAPHLVSLSVRLFRWRVAQNLRLTEVPNLKYLRLGSACAFTWMARTCALGSLQSLDIDLQGFDLSVGGSSSKEWPSLVSRLRSLRSLDLQNTVPSGAMKYPDRTIVLPHLQRLGVWGVKEVQNMNFNLPALQTLSFDCAIEAAPSLPRVTPVEVIWLHRYPEKNWHRSPPEDRKAFLGCVIGQYHSATRLVFPDWTKEPLIDALQEIERRGTVPLSSCCVMMEKSGGDRVPLNWRGGTGGEGTR